MNDLRTRAFTGILFVVVMVLSILGHEWSTFGLFMIIVLIGSQELISLTSKKTSFLGAAMQGLTFACLSSSFFELISFQILVAIILTSQVLPSLLARDFKIIGSSLMAFCLITLPFALLTYLPGISNERFALLSFFLLLWANDTFAYLVGSKLGRTKLWERISPKKTWEGFFGGLIASMGVSYLLGPKAGWPTENALVIAALIGILGTTGDLIESSLKRKAQVKDSGTLLPGHGGILDRFDGVMLSAPMVFIYLWWNDLILLPSAL